MISKIHFISGLPRSGSTLLAAILRQNIACHAAIESPLAEIFAGLIKTMNGSEGSLFISADQSQMMLRSLVASYYSRLSGTTWIFDSNRLWCALLPALAELFPDSRIICCIRNPAWILDSVERLIQRNALLTSKMFPNEIGTVYSRADSAMHNRFLGSSLHSLRQAWFSEHADRLIAIPYESLTSRPVEVIEQLYEALGMESFTHDFNHLQYEEKEFDARIGMPGLHRVLPKVAPQTRETILPPDLFQMHNREFWKMPGENPRRVRIL